MRGGGGWRKLVEIPLHSHYRCNSHTNGVQRWSRKMVEIFNYSSRIESECIKWLIVDAENYVDNNNLIIAWLDVTCLYWIQFWSQSGSPTGDLRRQFPKRRGVALFINKTNDLVLLTKRNSSPEEENIYLEVYRHRWGRISTYKHQNYHGTSLSGR